MAFHFAYPQAISIGGERSPLWRTSCVFLVGRWYEKVIFSLALGTFGLGMAEFGIMGVLTELARDVGITIPAAGHMISFYAFGVVLGAPIIALFPTAFLSSIFCCFWSRCA